MRIQLTSIITVTLIHIHVHIILIHDDQLYTSPLSIEIKLLSHPQNANTHLFPSHSNKKETEKVEPKNKK